MKITKLAQVGGGPPPGHVRVEVTFDGKGNRKAVIIAHGPGTTCSNADADMLKDLEDAEVPGYGDMVEPSNAGLTEEGIAALRKVKVQQQPEAPQPQGPFVDQEEEEEEMGSRFGI